MMSTAIASNSETRYTLTMEKQLRRYLKRTGMTQSQFARLVGVHRSVVGHWVSGYCKPANGRKAQIAQVTGIKLEELLWFMAGKEG
jgi:transcriptional regulator with XRE-family HTH domain